MEEESKSKSSTGLRSNVGGLLCYLLGFITGIIFFLIEKQDKFVRFHAMQSIIVFGAFFVINWVLAFIPVVNLFITPLISLISLILWILLMIKAYQGEKFKLPVAGDIAERQA